MRLFLAIELSETIKACLTATQNSLKTLPWKITWVDPKDFHLTVEFLGETKREKIASIKTTLTDTTSYIPVFSLCLADLVLIPNRRHPQVLAVGLKGDLEKFIQLKKAIRQKLSQLEFNLEEKKAVHITLGRVKDGLTPTSRRILAEQVKKTKPLAGPIYVDSIVLIESELTKAGPIYTKLFTAALKI